MVIAWSGGFIGVRFATEHAGVFHVLFWRSLVSGLLLLPFALTLGPPWRCRTFAWQVGEGVFAMAAYLGCYTLAIGQGVPTGLVALITDLLPLMVAMLSWPLAGQALSGRQWTGTLLGLAGVLIASGVSARSGTAPAWAYALPALGTLALAVASLVARHDRPDALAVHQRLCIQCLSASAVFASIAAYQGGPAPSPDPRFVGGILWLVFVATFGAWGLYYLALRRSSAARVTAVLYLSPPVTMVWAWLMFDESLTLSMALGFAVSLAGIALFARPAGTRA